MRPLLPLLLSLLALLAGLHAAPLVGDHRVQLRQTLLNVDALLQDGERQLDDFQSEPVMDPSFIEDRATLTEDPAPSTETQPLQTNELTPAPAATSTSNGSATLSPNGKEMHPALTVTPQMAAPPPVTENTAQIVPDLQVAPHAAPALVTHVNPIAPNATNLVTPKPLITPTIGEIPKVSDAEVAAKKAEEVLSKASWTAEFLNTKKSPSDHLIQQTIANIKKIEALDLGAVAPGDRLQYQPHREINEQSKSIEEGSAPVLSVPGASEEQVEIAVVKIGQTLANLTERVGKLDTQAEAVLNKVFGESRPNNSRELEAQELAELAKQARIRRESEIASLIRDEVRILTNQIHMELRVLKSNFFSELRELLYGLRRGLYNEFLRSQETQSRLEAIAGGRIPLGNIDLKDEIILRPMQEKADITEAITQKINTAFNKAQAIAGRVMQSHNTAAHQELSEAAEAELHAIEPSRSTLRQSLEDEASVQRARDAQKLLEKEKTKLHSDTKAEKEATATKLKAQAKEQTRMDLTDETTNSEVLEAEKVAMQRALENTEQSERDAAKTSLLRTANVESDDPLQLLNKAEKTLANSPASAAGVSVSL